MTNAVYTMTVRALAGVVSERAAETMVRSVLREQNLLPENVSAQEMQRMLSGPLLSRLSTVMPAARARRELLALSAQMADRYPKAPTLFIESGPSATWDDAPDTEMWNDLGLGADDFEFDDPEYAAGLSGRSYDLNTTMDQDTLIQTLGRLSGVQGVMVCRANGEVLRVRAVRDANGLAGVVAASAMLFQKRALRLLSADLGGQTVCVCPLGEHCVAVIASSQANVGRLLVELQQIKVAA
ncbi:roadblock/LC7 domain-containing protein [Deinococcus xianganensis]|uniref:Roadblock/LC7 domain-containing protein n=1 Tax=Deinococcus xianganensis TaxID=1507289 RepID=A0A6I4YJE0_9DEIO|nr:roadblock/LC7 domain-containing protein [Deinococcus xianganensis]MXV21592.1 roadblock/LC7 domain-containing protein [Deinococcus xianganensis]